MTTLIGGGTGPAEGTRATTCTPSPWAIREMLLAMDECPVNVLLLGKGNTVSLDGLREQARPASGGFKLHEDWGSTPAAIDACLRIADETGVQVAIHTDTLNEAGYVQTTLGGDRRADDPRLPHGGRGRRPRAGHHHASPAQPNVLPSSTNPTRPHTVNTVDEHLDMLIVCHHLNPRIPEDLAFAESRIRGHDDRRRGRPARPGRDLDDRLRLAGDGAGGRDDHPHLADRARDGGAARRRRRTSGCKRYVAKYTICPAIAHGIADEVGSRRGRQARRPRAVGPGVLRDPPAAGDQGRRDRLRADGRRQRLDPDAAAGPDAADVRGLAAGWPRAAR